jgi:hypothetical protein
MLPLAATAANPLDYTSLLSGDQTALRQPEAPAPAAILAASLPVTAGSPNATQRSCSLW